MNCEFEQKRFDSFDIKCPYCIDTMTLLTFQSAFKRWVGSTPPVSHYLVNLDTCQLAREGEGWGWGWLQRSVTQMLRNTLRAKL